MNFRKRLLDGELLVGTFQKTPSMMIAEVLAMTDVDAVCIDTEHSPFDRRDIDACVFAYHSAHKPSLVRTQSGAAEHILNALDCGATGVIVPHVDSAAKARSIAQSCHYGNQGRGYAGSTRAAAYTGHSVEQNLQNGANVTVIAQIEDLAAMDEIDEIAAVSGIDCLFIGMMDLTVSLGCHSADENIVIETAERICEAANASNRRLGIFVPNPDQIPFWQERGVSLFLLGSEHGFIKQGANALIQQSK